MILTALVDTATLARHLGDPDWVVFDCRHDLADPGRGRAEYGQRHVPGARFLHLDEDLSAPKTGKNGRHPLPDPAKLAATLGQAGVDSAKQVVAYDAQGGMVAARLWWLLR
ncbi:MAG TPA: rhodanese-like domain-containing protein, partial [Burkholderiales bacterium]|nr:rhodanese-like domain-containing protein [Burkholderiales bacterium]